MKNAKILTFSNLYILLWLIYGLQSLIFGNSGTIYSQVIILFLTAASLYYSIFALFFYKLPLFMKVLAVFVSFLSIYGLLLLIGPNTTYSTSKGTVSNYLYLIGVFNSLLPIFPFYVFTRQGNLTKNNLQKWIFIFFVSVTIQYFQHHRQTLLEAILVGSQREEFTNNFGYEFLSVIPLLAFFSKQRILQFLSLAYATTFILLAMKRGAIIICAVCVAWFLFVNFKNTPIKNRIGIIVLSALFVVVSYFVIRNLVETSDFFNQRIENTLEGDSSNRDKLFSSFLNHFIHEQNPLRFLFGNGANATLTIMNQYAHNDWLELAINQGIIGVIIYLVYWLCFYKSIKQARFDNELYLAISSLFIIYFLRTLFSMSYGDMSIYATCCLGYCMGRISENVQTTNSSQ